MDFSKIKKGLFSFKNPDQINVMPSPNPIKLEEITYSQYGFQQAGKLAGTLPGLRICLQRIYCDYKDEIRVDTQKQNELKQPYKVKIEDYLGHNKTLEERILKLKEQEIPKNQLKIEKLHDEISEIKKRPEIITGDDAGRLSFIIGVIILLFLTIYLFIFYSSASYSAFFKAFSPNSVGIADSIFDPKALGAALSAGFTELILIVTIPFVFLGLGYLIHKFQELKDWTRLLKIGMLMLVTFVFDTILAFEITSKIYNLQKANSFVPMPDYTLNDAFGAVNFWLIIFAGFVVYIIWGIVFNFAMEAYAKLDKIKVAIQEKNKQIEKHDELIKDLETQIDKMTYTISENIKEVKKLKSIIDGSIIPREFEHNIYQFMEGWLAWMKGFNKPGSELQQAEDIGQEFVRVTVSPIDNYSNN